MDKPIEALKIWSKNTTQESCERVVSLLKKEATAANI